MSMNSTVHSQVRSILFRSGMGNPDGWNYNAIGLRFDLSQSFDVIALRIRVAGPGLTTNFLRGGFGKALRTTDRDAYARWFAPRLERGALSVLKKRTDRSVHASGLVADQEFTAGDRVV